MAFVRLTPAAPSPNLHLIEVEFGQSRTVGRGQQADVTVDDPSLSRVHARLTVDPDGQINIDDLGSTNGVFVNGTEQLKSRVAPGDMVRFGRVEYVVSRLGEAAPAAAAPPLYTAGVQMNTDPSTFDVLGRRYFFRANFKF